MAPVTSTTIKALYIHILYGHCSIFYYMAPYIYVYIYLSGFLSVCLYSINVKTAEPIGPKLCVGPHMTPEKRFMDDQNFKN